MASSDKNISHRGEYFLSILEVKERKRIRPFLKNFELSCILSSFEESLLVIPFPCEQHHEELQMVHNYIRQLIIARLGEKMLFNAVYKADKSSEESASVLIKRITKDPTEDNNGGFSQVPDISVNFTKV